MTRTTLRIRLLTDAIFTRHNATIGGGASLPYMPGATLLGAAAARLYHEPGSTNFSDVLSAEWWYERARSVALSRDYQLQTFARRRDGAERTRLALTTQATLRAAAW